MSYPSIYIEYLKTSGGSRCARCSSTNTGFYSLCPRHRKMARDRYRNWADVRRNQGLCIKCNHPAPVVIRATGKTQQGVYCKRHRRLNAKHCLEWSHANRNKIKAKFAQLKANGVCTHCCLFQASEGHVVCSRCLVKRRAYRRQREQFASTRRYR